MSILSGWPDKKRKYTILVERNSAGLRPDTFTEFMQAPCGRLLVHIVLKDMDMTERYADLKTRRKPVLPRIRQACRQENRRTVVHIINTDKNEKL